MSDEGWLSDRRLAWLLGITIVALIARLMFLGDRIAHWDEGRVGYEILRYMATGAWEYRPIVHGPFLPQVNKHVFAILGAGDFSARVIVAVVGGLLPLAAWLYRDHLDRVELVVLAGFLAADPLLLYYSRFMRNDVLVAAFAFVAFGCLLRLLESGRVRYLHFAALAFGLSLTTKENAILYPVAIGGAVILLFDHRLFLARDAEPSWKTVTRRHLWRVGRGLIRYRYHLAIAVIEILLIVVYFYAPRAGPTGGIGLWKALLTPSMLPDVIQAGTVGAGEKLVSQWIQGSLNEHGYLPFLGSFLKALGGASGGLALFALIGFLVDRYGGDRPRNLVSLGFYWGFASVLGYPIAVDIRAPWSAIHAVVPLAIPAAVGIAIIYRWGMEALADNDRVGVGLAGLVLLLVAGQVAGTAVSGVYLNDQREGNVLVQYAQPEGEMRPALDAVDRAAADSNGLDVLWYGRYFLVENESQADRLPLADGEWYNRLPLPWYLELSEATVNSTATPGGLEAWLASEDPPVVITCQGVEECPSEGSMDGLRRRLDGYTELTYEGRQFRLEFVFFIEDRYLA